MSAILLRNPCYSETDLLRSEFVTMWNPEKGRFNAIMHNFYLLGVLPLHLGRSTALDDAVGYLLQTHKAMTSGITEAVGFVTPQSRALSHSRAIKSLQSALLDLSEETHSTTLAAIGTLTFAEAVSDYRRSSEQWIIHCKGRYTEKC